MSCVVVKLTALVMLMWCMIVDVTLLSPVGAAGSGATPAATKQLHLPTAPTTGPPRTAKFISNRSEILATEVTGNSSTSETPEILKDIWLIGLFPLQGKWAGGQGQLPAVEMGIADVNADPNILSGYRLRMTIDDTEVSGSNNNNFTRLFQLRAIPTRNHSSLFLILDFNLRDLYFLEVL